MGGGWGKFVFPPIVGNRSKVAFLILLEVDSGSGKSFFACWELMESQFSHIVGGRVEFLLGGISSLACRAKKTDSTQLENYEKVTAIRRQNYEKVTQVQIYETKPSPTRKLRESEHFMTHY